MISITTTTEDRGATLQLTGIETGIGEIVNELYRIVDEIVRREVELRSTVIWNVRTGFYAYMSWRTATVAGNEVQLGSSAPYAGPLEFGWKFRDSPGVLYPVVEETRDRVNEALREWIHSLAEQ